MYFLLSEYILQRRRRVFSTSTVQHVSNTETAPSNHLTCLTHYTVTEQSVRPFLHLKTRQVSHYDPNRIHCFAFKGPNRSSKNTQLYLALVQHIISFTINIQVKDTGRKKKERYKSGGSLDMNVFVNRKR